MPKALIQNLRGFAADLTRKRVRGHAVLLGLVLWGAYAINIATPGLKDREGQLKGADFLHFYVLGNIARLHDASMLYDASLQSALAKQLIGQDPGHRAPVVVLKQKVCQGFVDACRTLANT